MSQLFSINPEECPKVIPDIEFGVPEIHEKSWGQEVWVTNNEDFCGKILKFKKGSKFSAHKHLLKREVFLLTVGKIKFSYFQMNNADFFEREINPGECIYIPAGQLHQIEALEESEVIEFSTPHYSADSYRVFKGNSQGVK
jgi:mannose-6-phosphate isomerase-like protein (cupin superfamily)